jgi:MFS family permease
MSWSSPSTRLRLPAPPTPGAALFAGLSVIESTARALVVTVMALQSYELLETAQNVSYLAAFVGVFSFFSGLLLPLVIRAFTRRWTYTLGVVALIVSLACFAAYTAPAQIVGVMLRMFGTACLMITANLYLMDYIEKHQLVRADSLRMTGAMVGWTIGPYAGVLMGEVWGRDSVFLLSAVFSLMLLAYFWYLRLSDSKVIIPARRPPENPLLFIPRFVGQPRLRLAWLIAFGRSCFWSAIFTYGPILMVEAGKGNEMGGLLISIANLMLLSAVPWGWLAIRKGVRHVILIGFLGVAASLLATGIAGTQWPLLAGFFLVVAALFCSGLDAVGSVPYYRAVKPRERTQMSGVYRSYIDFSDLVPNIVYGVLLGLFGLGSVFIALAGFLLVVAAVSWRYLPRSM